MKTPILIAAMLTVSLAASAQQSKGTAAKSSPDPVPHATVEGCLSQPTAGNFVLVRASGKKYYLSGTPAKFDGLIGKEIRVYGALKSPDSLAAIKQTQAEMAAGPPEQIVVEEISKLYDSCEEGAAGPQKRHVAGSGDKH